MFNQQQPQFKELARLVAGSEHRVVPFLGAGVSVYGTPSERLPLWNQLIEVLKKRGREEYCLISAEQERAIDALLADNKQIAAIDYLLSILGNAQFRILIEEIFNTDTRPIPPAITILTTISWSFMVTTNLDNFIETAWRDRQPRALRVVTGVDTTRLAQAVGESAPDLSSTLAKIHGTLERQESWILTSAQYELLLKRTPGYVEALKSLFLRTLLFVGYGLRDNDFESLLAHIQIIYPLGVGRFFVLFGDHLRGSPSVRKLIRDYGVQPIWYRYHAERANEPDAGHAEMCECLQLLVDAWLHRRQSTPVTLKYFPELDPGFVGRQQVLQQIANVLFKGASPGLQLVGFGGEGKTSLVQSFLHTYKEDLDKSSLRAVFGCSFYRSDIGRFLHDAYSALETNPRVLPIHQKVAALSKILENQPILLVLDGVESLIDERGEISSLYLDQVIRAALNGPGFLLVTTRIPLRMDLARIDLNPLSEAEATLLLEEWGLDASAREIQHLIRRHSGRHALSLRIMASFLGGAGDRAASPLDGATLEQIPDDSDPSRANKSWRVLREYCKNLSQEHIALMQCFSRFRRPVHVRVLLSCLSRSVDAGGLNERLEGKDLRALIHDLLDRRLIMLEASSVLTAHPLVRSYFQATTPETAALPLERAICAHYEQILGGALPTTFEEALQYFDLCYHAAKANNWTLFDRLFRHTINRDHRNYLGYTLGAWEEYLELASLTFPDGNMEREPLIDPTYYHACVARGLKHLGRSAEAWAHYTRCIRTSSMTRDVNTAKYVNNLLTLTIAMGRLTISRALLPLNFSTLAWIEEDWHSRWQTEHALFSAAYLASLMGDRGAATEYGDSALTVWDGFADKHPLLYYTHRLYFSDFLRAGDVAERRRARALAEEALGIAVQHQWKETIAIANRCLCAIHRRDSDELSQRTDQYNQAVACIETAQGVANEYKTPRFELEIMLEEILLRITGSLRGLGSADKDRLSGLLKRSHFLLKRCQFHLYEPRLLLCEAWYEVLFGSRPRAVERCGKAFAISRSTGNVFDLFGESVLVGSLLDELAGLFGVPDVLVVEPHIFPSVPDLLSAEVRPEQITDLMVSLEDS